MAGPGKIMGSRSVTEVVAVVTSGFAEAVFNAWYVRGDRSRREAELHCGWLTGDAVGSPSSSCHSMLVVL